MDRNAQISNTSCVEYLSHNSYELRNGKHPIYAWGKLFFHSAADGGEKVESFTFRVITFHHLQLPFLELHILVF